MIDDLIRQTQETNQWTVLLLEVDAAMSRMGTFQDPLEDKLIGLTYGQWQMELARGASIAILEFVQRECNKPS